MPRKLESVATPTPSDLDIAQAAVPLPISHIAKELGLTEDDYDPHGKLKAKARYHACERSAARGQRATCRHASACSPLLPHPSSATLQVKLSLIEKNAAKPNGYYGTRAARLLPDLSG